MLQNTHKFLITVVVCLGIMSAPPIHAASTIKSIQYTAALLRGPAAYLAYKFRNDTSLRAHAIKIAIHSVRLLDDLLAPTTTSQKALNREAFMEVIKGLSTWQHPVGWNIYDSTTIIKELKACLTGKNSTPVIATDDHEHELLRSMILPAVEMICALARTMPNVGKSNNLATIGISMVRLCELYYAAPRNSAHRKVIGGLLVACIVEFLVKSTRPYKSQHHEQHPQPLLKIIFDEDQNKITWISVWQEKQRS
ncbi:MAG: hypothetical protein WC365_02870 [Candidatus Babeliales bacterium]